MLSKLRMEWTLPNILTTVRLIAIPFMGFFIFAGQAEGEKGEFYNILALAFFVGIWLTDAADGYIARKYDMISDFGKIYDPFVDKLFQFTTAFIMLLIGKMPLWVVIYILVKEIIMILGGAYFLQQRMLVVHSKWYGKVSTVLFVIALAVLFFLREDTKYLANYIFIAPVLMATFSTVCYAVTAVRNFEELGNDPSDIKEDSPNSTETKSDDKKEA
ncbi:MAG: CDP-alcohol phosphatidyltransferase family protein [Clostridiaceae bacterium]|nr:CDP-alcohol phosphatidyltransferase family protein [Clostridiaceae bacterium]